MLARGLVGVDPNSLVGLVWVLSLSCHEVRGDRRYRKKMDGWLVNVKWKVGIRRTNINGLGWIWYFHTYFNGWLFLCCEAMTHRLQSGDISMIDFTRRIHVWYIYLHLADVFKGKCWQIYQSHGSYGSPPNVPNELLADDNTSTEASRGRLQVSSTVYLGKF